MRSTSIGSLVLLLLGYAAAKKIPSYVTVCHRNTTKSELKACVLKAVEQMRPHLPDGIPEMFIPPMNPLFLPEATLDSGTNFQASFKNIHVYYAHEFKIENIDVNLENVSLDIEISFPRLRLRSQYKFEGKILILQLHGEGPADGNFTNVRGRLLAEGKRYPKNGHEYISVTNTQLDLKLGRPVFQFGNLFGDNKELNDRTNNVINENIEDFLKELGPVIIQTVKEVVFGIVDRIFTRFSFDELFPE